jgi:hypothetical protein
MIQEAFAQLGHTAFLIGGQEQELAIIQEAFAQLGHTAFLDPAHANWFEGMGEHLLAAVVRDGQGHAVRCKPDGKGDGDSNGGGTGFGSGGGEGGEYNGGGTSCGGGYGNGNGDGSGRRRR